MKLRRAAILAAAALLPLAAHPAGTTSLSSYLRQVPAPPRSAQEAYKASVVDDAQVLGGAWVDIEPPPAFKDLERKLLGEGVLAASQGTGPTPTVPGMAAPTDAASAAAMADAIQKMTPAEQQAMAQQMMTQQSAQMTPGAMAPADQQMAVLLGKRQESGMVRMQQALKAEQDWALVLRRWDAEHQVLLDEENVKLSAWTGRCAKGTVAPTHVIKRKYADEHLALVAGQLNEGLGTFEKRRVMAVDETGFADQLAPLAIKAQGPLSKQGYSAARGDAVRSLSAMASVSEQLYRRAAYWYMVKRALERDVLCESTLY